MIGIDLVKIDRIKKLLNNPRFLNKVFSKEEIDYFESVNFKIETIAGSFAAKEAISKLIGTGIGPIAFKDIIISHDSFGKPICNFTEKGKKIIIEKNIKNIELSISHELEYAVAVAYSDFQKRYFNKKIKNLPKLIKRVEESHKGSYGKITLIGGSKGMSGSILLSSKAALRTGSGLVYTAVPQGISESVEARSLENIVISINDNNKNHFVKESMEEINNAIKKSDAICFGPGVGRFEEIYDILSYILEFNKPLVLDADGLNCLQGKTDILKNTNTCITPHRMEMARLIDKDISYVNKEAINVAMFFSKLYNIIVVLKGHNTIVTNGEDIYINNTGNAGMATAGSGDVLTGIITSLAGQGYDLFDAAKLAVFLHGLAGDIAADKIGQDSIIAGDIIDNISEAIREKRFLDERNFDISDMGGDKS